MNEQFKKSVSLPNKLTGKLGLKNLMDPNNVFKSSLGIPWTNDQTLMLIFNSFNSQVLNTQDLQ